MNTGALSSNTAAKDRAAKASISNISNDKQNWLMHLYFVRKDFEKCHSVVKKIQSETKGNCEYATYVQGLTMRLEGNVNESLRLFQLCSALNSQNIESFKQVARSLFLLARHKAALDVYAEAEKLSPDDWVIAHNKGICYMYLKELTSAKDCLRRAITLKANELSYIMLGKVHLAEANVQMAITAFQQALELSPESAEILSTLGLLYMQIGDYQRAFDSLGSSMTFEAGNSKAILAAGSMLQTHGDHEVALSKYRLALSQNPESGALWNNIGMCFFSKKKYITAVTCLKRAHYLAPFHWMVHYNLALVHCTMQQYASAFHFVTASISLKPHVSQLFMLLAIVLTKLNDKENAQQAYAQAFKIDEKDPLISLNFAIFLYNCGETAKSKVQMQLLEKNLLVKKFSEDEEFQSMYKRLSAVFHLGESVVSDVEKKQSS